MRTVITNKIYIYNASLSVFDYCNRNLVIVNPKYQQLMRLGKKEEIQRYHIQEHMSLFVARGQDLVLPFGTLSAVWPLIKDSPYELKFNDAGDISNKDETITQALYDYQEEAVQKMLGNRGGVLVGGCGSGKTNVGLEIIHRIGKKALWLCHTGDLLRQTVSRLKHLYPNSRVGTITEGKVNIDDITISTIQTISMLDPSTYKDQFDVVVCDECFPAGTLVRTKNGLQKIETLQRDDLVASYNHKENKVEYKKIKWCFKKDANDLLELTLSNGQKIVCTSNHPFYTENGYIQAKNLHGRKVLLSNMWGKIEERKIFDWIRVESIKNIERASGESFERYCSDGYVYNIEVEDNNNYFVNDILVHNCHHVSSSPTLLKMFGKVIEQIPARYKFGLTATPSRQDTLIKTMYTLIGTNQKGEYAPVWQIDREDTNTLTATHQKFDLNTPFCYEMLNEDGTFNYAGLIDYLSTNEDRNNAIAQNVLNYKERKQLVLCARIEQCELLNQKLLDLGLKSVILVGSVSAKKRNQILNQEVYWDVIVASQSLAKEGLDVKELSVLHWASPINDKAMTIQSAGRIERVCPNKPDPIVIDYVDVNIPYCTSRYKSRVNYLKKRY